MKMQNTEMEFVTFDAQDVITTSTTIVPTYFSGALKDSRGSGTAFNNTSDSWFVGDGVAINKAASTINGGTWDYNDSRDFTDYYLINSASYDSGTHSYAINATGYKSAPGGDSLDSWQEIFAYLSSIAQ